MAERRRPSGTIAFLFTDIESSTELWQQYREAMTRAVLSLDELVEDVAAAHRGVMVHERGEGDSHFIVFDQTSRAIVAAADLLAAVTRARKSYRPPEDNHGGSALERAEKSDRQTMCAQFHRLWRRVSVSGYTGLAGRRYPSVPVPDFRALLSGTHRGGSRRPSDPDRMPFPGGGLRRISWRYGRPGTVVTEILRGRDRANASE